MAIGNWLKLNELNQNEATVAFKLKSISYIRDVVSLTSLGKCI